MPKCKKSGCCEEAVPYGKRYCPHHMQEYRRNQAEYEAIYATLRCCEQCGEKLTKTGHDRGDRLCRSCEERQEQERIQNHYASIRIEQRRKKIADLDAAQTVDSLREWIKTYMLSE